MKYEIATEHDLTHDRLITSISNIVRILKNNSIEQIKVLFGFGWGYHFNNWREMELSVEDVLPLVDFVEKQKHGLIGNDDLFIIFNKGNFTSEIVFCHHGGIEWRFARKYNENDLFNQLNGYFRSNYKELVLRKNDQKSSWIKMNFDDLDDIE